MYLERLGRVSIGQQIEPVSKEQEIEYYRKYYEEQGKFPEPTQVLLETRTDCNLRCKFCPQGVRTRPTGIMEWDVFKKIIGDLGRADFSGRIAFFITNEPLLDDRLRDMLSYARKHCARAFLDMNTNGVKLTPALLEALFKAGLDNVNIEDYLPPKKYDSRYRRPNITAILEGFQHNPKITYHPRRTNEVLSNRSGNVPKEKAVKAENSPEMFCNYPFRKLAVGTSGDVVICCMDYEYEIKFGNVMQQDIFEIWHSEPANQYRMALLGGERKWFCEDCDEGLYGGAIIDE